MKTRNWIQFSDKLPRPYQSITWKASYLDGIYIDCWSAWSENSGWILTGTCGIYKDIVFSEDKFINDFYYIN